MRLRFASLFSWMVFAGLGVSRPVVAESRVVPLSEVRSILGIPAYSQADRALIANQAELMMEQLFVHRDLKVDAFGADHDPVPRLKTIRNTCSVMDNEVFHTAVASTFSDLHDLHTNYIAPAPRSCAVTFIPIRMAHTIEAGKERVIVSRKLKTREDLTSAIKVGDVLLRVNERAVKDVIAELGHISGGANPDAMQQRAIQMLSMRSLSSQALPDESGLRLEFESSNGKYEVEIPWLAQVDDDCVRAAGQGSASPFLSLNMGADPFQKTFNQVFGLDEAGGSTRKSSHFRPGKTAAPKLQLEHYQRRFNRLFSQPSVAPILPMTEEDPWSEIFEFATISTPAGKLGYIRLKTFYWENPSLDVATVTEAFRRALEEGMPEATGLVIDVRGNPGGIIVFAEKLLQLFSARVVQPSTVRMLANTLNKTIFEQANGGENRWSLAVSESIGRGDRYTPPMAITPESEANTLGQAWFKPVVVLTDANCYSACDLFAAGMQDNRAATIIGIHSTTGAGGANVMEFNTFRQILANLPNNPLKQLPFGQNMRVSWRQSVRAGINHGQVLENRGVLSDVRIPLTPADIQGGESRELMRAIHRVIDSSRPEVDAEIAARRGGVISLSNGAPAAWIEKIKGVDEIKVERGDEILAVISADSAGGVVDAKIELPDLAHEWNDERLVVTGTRAGEAAFRVVRELHWRGEYFEIPDDGLRWTFSDQDQYSPYFVNLKGPANSGWQVVDGRLRVGRGATYESRVLTRALFPLALNGKGVKVKLDFAVEAETMSDSLRIFVRDPATAVRTEVYAGSNVSFTRGASFTLPPGMQRLELIFEFESDENWNLSGPVVDNLQVKLLP